VTLYVMPILFALFTWWFFTGLVLYVVGRPRASHYNAMLATTALLAAGLWGISYSSTDTSVGGAYVAFASALAVWGWHEMGFLLGFVTGPRKTPSPEKSGGRAPLGASVEVVIYHEFAIALTAALLVILSSDAPNQIGLWTFVILWLARLSTKFNIYLGVPNHTEQFLPNHLKYIASYFCRRSMNLLFPISVTVSTIITAMLIEQAVSADALPYQVAGSVFLATLMALAVIEHWFLVLPIPSAELWTWGLASRRPELASKPEPGVTATISATWSQHSSSKDIISTRAAVTGAGA
jgi:putative photosynthetic complex assembly protein 2